MPELRTSIEAVRTSLWLALGLIAACTKDPPTIEPGTGTGSSGMTGGSSTEATPTSGGPTTGTSGGGISTGTSSGDSSGAVDATGVTTGGVTTGGGSTGGVTTGGGSTTIDGTSSSGGGESSTGDLPPGCVELMQATDPPVPSGWQQCGDQLAHRVEAVACLVPASPSLCNPEAVNKLCESNADCVDQKFGSCQNVLMVGACECMEGCQTDADCAPGWVCRCGGPELGGYTRCVQSSCTTDADCPGERCQFAASLGVDCEPEVTEGACTTPMDRCDSDGDCGGGPCMSGGAWVCAGVVCGRPLLVEDRAVVAAAVRREDWQGRVVVPSVPPELRARLAAHWTAVALAEHASIASFARFGLQLLAVGAPPELVLAAQQALADEVEHARIGFALASMYAGYGVGPGALDCGDLRGGFDLESVLAAVIREACVGETLSALELREAADRAEAPALRELLLAIAGDEQRHAELGWRFVQWALERADAGQRGRAEAVFVGAVAEARAAAMEFAREGEAPELRAYGVVDAGLRAVVWREGLAGLVLPAAQVLCAAA
jgi:hypothetical protein